eukprot:TRINITY_DN12169_c0_g3_i1.p1 TRINITY_DN12169_c0_g3~~TRINITY_DN12169_c0_g3_i1.p1  ORF type:complete len:210 (-),score=26.59 TRINITY_DN12169_c0_g3_i1:389-1018(-)
MKWPHAAEQPFHDVEGPTSLMIQNIPCRATKVEVMAKLNTLGFSGTYDFLYLPQPAIGTKQARRMSNRGFAFINFKNAEVTQRFQELLAKTDVTLRSDYKVLRACPARAQGLDALWSCVMREPSATSIWVEGMGPDAMHCLSQDPSMHECDDVGCVANVVALMPMTVKFKLGDDASSPTIGFDDHVERMAMCPARNEPMRIYVDRDFYR